VQENRYPTWLDRVPKPEDVRRSLAHAATLPDQPQYVKRAAGDQRFALWLRLADQHAAAAARETRTAPAIQAAQFPWRGAYISCWSPRGAAEAAHDGANPITLQALREAELTGRPAIATGPTDVEIAQPPRTPEL
jgi:hypothetical protein